MLLVHFVEVMTTDKFKKKPFVIALAVRHFLEWLITVHVPAARSIYKILKKKSYIRSKTSEKSMYAGSTGPILEKIGTAQVRPIL